MQLLRSADVPIDRRARDFRYSRWRAGTGAIILAAAALALIAFGRLNNTWIPYYIAGVIIVTLLIFHNLVTARFRPTNWLVRMTDDGLFIKFRSYLNYRFSDQDPTVVFISLLRDQLGKVGKRTSSNTGPRRGQPTRHDDQNAALHRTGARRQLRATCERAG